MNDPWDDRRAGDADDRAYLTRRAQEERARAAQAIDVGVAFAHRRLAEAYAQRLAALVG